MAVGDAHVFSGFLTPVLKQLFFPKPLTTFLACFCRGERRKYAGKKSRFNRGSNSQPPGHESDTLTTEPHGWGGLLSEPTTEVNGNDPKFKTVAYLLIRIKITQVLSKYQSRSCDENIT